MTSKFAACAAIAVLISGVTINTDSPVGNPLAINEAKKTTAEDMSNWASAFQNSPEIARLVEHAGLHLDIGSLDKLPNYPESCSVLLGDARAVKDDAPKPPYAEKEWDSGLSSMESALKLFCKAEPVFAYGEMASALHHFSEFTDKVIDEFPELEESNSPQALMDPDTRSLLEFNPITGQ
jgi:hypothetical protein